MLMTHAGTTPIAFLNCDSSRLLTVTPGNFRTFFQSVFVNVCLRRYGDFNFDHFLNFMQRSKDADFHF